MQPISTTLIPNPQVRAWQLHGAGVHQNRAIEEQALPLIRQFCTALVAENIRYCHWKSNAAIERSASGENDLDLLIHRKDRERFSALVAALGFKEAGHRGEAYLPGVVSYYGYEPTAGRLIHLHAHYQLVLGHDRTKNYRLPLEAAYLAASTRQGLFYLPTPEFEFVVFVLRMVLKFATWDAVLGRQAKLPAAAKRELAYLLERVQWAEVNRILTEHLPVISPELFARAAQVIEGRTTLFERIKVGRLIEHALQPHTRRAGSEDLLLKGWRRVENGVRRRLRRSITKARMSGGGAMIAIVGGDGAGKSTAISGLSKWLSKDLDTKRVHLGKPPRSLATRLMRTFVKVMNLPAKRSGAKAAQADGAATSFPGYGALLLQLCTAHDRYWAYVKARRFVNNGGIVICDRFPLAQIRRMDGPQIAQMAGPRAEQRFVRWLIQREARYYARFAQPELLFILRLDPAVALQRKTEEAPALVAARSMEIWQADWRNSGAQVIDAAQSKDAVLATLKTIIWSHL
jgi:thymidylate kinase